MRLFLINSEGEKDITRLIGRVVWSGEYTQVARRLEFTIAVSPTDYFWDRVTIMPGNMIKFYDQGVLLFSGYVFTKEKSHQGDTMTVTCYDGSIYLLKNQGAYNFKNTAAENIAAMICNDFDIPAGEFAPTGIIQSFISIGDSLYDIIMKAYTKAAEQNGKKYIMVMVDGKVSVIERGDLAIDYVLENEKDLTNSTYSESIENMVNTVKIVNEVGDTSSTAVTFNDE